MRQPQYDKVNSDGENLLQLAHPAAVPVLQGKLQHLGRKWVDLRGRMGKQVNSRCGFVGISNVQWRIVLFPLWQQRCL